MDGRVWCETNEGRGSQFILELPLEMREAKTRLPPKPYTFTINPKP